MALRGVQRRSNLGLGWLEIASGFALAMTVLESCRVIKTDSTLENPYNSTTPHEFARHVAVAKIVSVWEGSDLRGFRQLPDPAKGVRDLAIWRCGC